MNAAYEFVTGPLAWVAWGIFLLGSAWRLFSMYQLAKKKEAAALAFMSWRYSCAPSSTGSSPSTPWAGRRTRP